MKMRDNWVMRLGQIVVMLVIAAVVVRLFH
jgi:hypothetical protein